MNDLQTVHVQDTYFLIISPNKERFRTLFIPPERGLKCGSLDA
jgi:hypothetical protein